MTYTNVSPRWGYGMFHMAHWATDVSPLRGYGMLHLAHWATDVSPRSGSDLSMQGLQSCHPYGVMIDLP